VTVYVTGPELVSELEGTLIAIVGAVVSTVIGVGAEEPPVGLLTTAV